MIQYIQKRDGNRVFCDGQKIANAVGKAALAAKESSIDANLIAQKVLYQASALNTTVCDVETIQDFVEQQLMKEGYTEVARLYILYREQRRKVREGKALVDETTRLFHDYLDERDWQVKENANTRKSINGMNNYIRETFTKQYWLHEVYTPEIRAAHSEGDFHIHDLGFFGPYCCGWDVRQLLTMGFGGVSGKVSSKPAKHLRSFLGQIVNATFSTQGESAGAQAWSSLDTYCAPFIRYDRLQMKDVKQALQEFVFNLNVPTRVGFQCPFSNITLDLKVPRLLKDQSVVLGGELLSEPYGDFQKEMDMFNLAFCEVMMEGDASGRVFTFPIPTINITKDFDWDSPVTDAIMEMTNKYGIPYFSNYISSDLSPEDALSMCCRLRLDTSQLRKRGGGLFGSNPLTGSIGVVTLNLPRLAYTCADEQEFLKKLEKLAILAKDSLQIKRKTIEKQTDMGMYPFSSRWLQTVKDREGAWWAQHFSTIGIVGMHEATLNLFGTEGGMGTPKGQQCALKVLDTLRTLMEQFQLETGTLYNLEATPAEGTSHRLAQRDRSMYENIIVSGEKAPYYTNSSQLPVSYTDDIFKTLEMQDEIQCKYTGGTVLHLYIGERIEDSEITKKLLRKIFSTYRLPYVSITPTFSTCDDHGYLSGETPICPVCGKETEIWTRVVGYLRPIRDFHDGKKEEYRQRVVYRMENVAI